MKSRTGYWKICLGVLLPVALLVGGCTTPAPEVETTTIPAQTEAAQIANPASENCVKQGGNLTIENRGDGGQFGVCYFEDNQQCEEWALMRGDCPVCGIKVTGYVTDAGRYCAITGGEYTVTGNSGAGDEQGTCTFKDGSQCEAWDFYNGKCAPGAAPTPLGSTIQPLIMEVCDGEAQAMAHFLDVIEVTQSEAPLSDPVTGLSGTGCMATVTGNGVKFKSPDAALKSLDGMLKDAGWIEDSQLAAGGPAAITAGYRKGDQICLASAGWKPDESANCPKDQPISACPVTPEQQLYTITLNCGVESTSASASSTLVPLKDALANLQPQDVFRNFYDITQVPRPSGQMEQIREFLVNFGQRLGLETVVDEAGNVLIRKPASTGLENRPGVILQAHMDMVPQAASGKEFDFATQPVPVFVNGDYIITDGTTLGADNGIGMALIMAVLGSEILQTGPLEALFTVDEETTMSGASELKGDLLQGRILINMDGEKAGEFTIVSAGGERASVHQAYTQAPAPEAMPSYVVRVQGLQGGHSGVDINKGRGHATKLLVRLLAGAEEQFGLRLASISGGTVANAIPREAEAVIFLPVDQVEAFTAYVRDYEATIRSELAATEPELAVQIDAVQPPAQVMEVEIQNTLLNALYGTPQGVARMSDAVPGLVETSNNLGVTAVHDGQMELVCTLRSSVESQLEDMKQMITSIWELAGYPVEVSGWYSAWTPNPGSPILGLMRSTYAELNGTEPVISAVHAGLECGTIEGLYPGMDMISIGPDMEDVHSPTEKLYIPSVGKTLALLTEVLQRIPEAED